MRSRAMQFCSDPPMQNHSGVDTRGRAADPWDPTSGWEKAWTSSHDAYWVNFHTSAQPLPRHSRHLASCISHTAWHLHVELWTHQKPWAAFGVIGPSIALLGLAAPGGRGSRPRPAPLRGGLDPLPWGGFHGPRCPRPMGTVACLSRRSGNPGYAPADSSRPYVHSSRNLRTDQAGNPSSPIGLRLRPRRH
jgi:hypothetical protein